MSKSRFMGETYYAVIKNFYTANLSRSLAPSETPIILDSIQYSNKGQIKGDLYRLGIGRTMTKCAR